MREGLVFCSGYSRTLSLFVNIGEGQSGVVSVFMSGKPAYPMIATSALSKLIKYIDEGAGDISSIPLEIEGTDFQKRVWNELCIIPRGEVRTYGEIASRLGIPGGARAVGQAVAANRLPLLIPCHRIVASGNIGGFSAYGRLRTKRKLLSLEDSRCKHEDKKPHAPR